MRKLLLFIFFAASIATAQTPQFELTPKGFVNAAVPGQDYLVYEVPGKEKAALYNSVLLYLHSIYRNPDAVLSIVENKMITVNGSASNSIRRNSMHVFDMDYTYVVHFKDGKMKVDAPGFELTTYTGKRQELHLVWGWSLGGDNLGIYNKKGKLKSEKAKADLEAYFNKDIAALFAAAAEGQEDW